ncbi:MAG TPA: hypothetical protein VE291_13600 [Terracidiphilus sp.]|jgi:hypothetical protein|nr:hypothetical protein [Terracidiphilus sp.]
MNWLMRRKKAEDAAAGQIDKLDELDEKSLMEPDLMDPALRRTLRDFSATVHAWSDAELSRQRPSRTTAARATGLHHGGALIGWGLAAALLLATGGAYEYHQRELAQQTAARIAQQRLAADKSRVEERVEAQKDEELFASVDSAIAREVPSAMEPLEPLAVVADGSEGSHK